MRSKKIFSLFLAALMAASAVLASCANTDDSGTDDTTAQTGYDTTTAADTTTAETEDPLADNLPDVTYDGYNFRLFGDIADLKLYPTIYREEENGETVNDAVYNRNKQVEDRFDITITHVQASGNVYNLYQEAIRAIQGGEDAYDIICGESQNQIYLQNGLVNLYDIDAFDFDRVWWLPAADSQTINGKLYTIQSAISYNILAYARCVFVNLDLAKDNNITIPYDDIRNGEWYLDDWINMTKDVYKDVDGSGEREWSDVYGMAMTGMQYATIECFGVESVVMNDQGTALVENVMSDEFQKYAEKTCSWLFGGNQGVFYRTSSSGNEAVATMFKNGTLMTQLNFMQNMVNLVSEYDFEYTILPVPKLDETQENYRAGSVGNNFSIPTTVKDKERDGVIIEAMSRLGYIDVYPTYKDLALRGRYSTDKDCADMIDIIADSAWVSFAYMNFLGSNNPQTFYWEVWADQNATPAVASKYANMKNLYQSSIDELNEFYFGE